MVLETSTVPGFTRSTGSRTANVGYPTVGVNRTVSTGEPWTASPVPANGASAATTDSDSTGGSMRPPQKRDSKLEAASALFKQPAHPIIAGAPTLRRAGIAERLRSRLRPAGRPEPQAHPDATGTIAGSILPLQLRSRTHHGQRGRAGAGTRPHPAGVPSPVAALAPAGRSRGTRGSRPSARRQPRGAGGNRGRAGPAGATGVDRGGRAPDSGPGRRATAFPPRHRVPVPGRRWRPDRP